VSRWSADPLVFHLGAADLPDEAGPAAWARDVEDLARALDAAALPRRTRVGCVVPSHHVRLLLVPWNAAMQSRTARQAFAEHCLRETYGDLVAGCVVRAGEGAYASATLACAIDAGLLDALGRVFAERGLTLCSVRPSLVHELARIGGTLPPGASWVVLTEGDALTLLLLEDGRPLRVCVARGTPARLPQLLAREWFALGRDDRWTHVEVRPRRDAAGAAAVPELAGTA
jgi:hypothetical protein